MSFGGFGYCNLWGCLKVGMVYMSSIHTKGILIPSTPTNQQDHLSHFCYPWIMKNHGFVSLWRVPSPRYDSISKSCCEITRSISQWSPGHPDPKRWIKFINLWGNGPEKRLRSYCPKIGGWSPLSKYSVEIPTTCQLNANKHRLKNWMFISTSTFLNDVPVKLPGHVGWYPQYISLFPCYNPIHFTRVSMAACFMFPLIV